MEPYGKIEDLNVPKHPPEILSPSFAIQAPSKIHEIQNRSVRWRAGKALFPSSSLEEVVGQKLVSHPWNCVGTALELRWACETGSVVDQWSIKVLHNQERESHHLYHKTVRREQGRQISSKELDKIKGEEEKKNLP